MEVIAQPIYYKKRVKIWEITQDIREKVMKGKRKKSTNNVCYMVAMIYKADKGIVWYSIIKNAMEQIFYVFFFVYLTQYIF